jgi:hypothetical protein
MLILVIFYSISCHSIKIATDNNKKPSVIEDKTSSKILFLSYAITKKINDLNLELINSNIVKGKIKEGINKKPNDGDLKLSVLDKNKIEISSFYISDPLFQVIEYVNEKKQLQSKKLELTKNDFFVRLQYKNKMKYITIEKIFLNKKSVHLLTSKIN